MLARDIMTAINTYLTPGQPVVNAWQQLLEQQVSALPVTNAQGDVIGLVTRDHLIEAGPGILNQSLLVEQIMEQTVYTVNEDTTLAEAWGLHGCYFPVKNKDNRLIGILDKNTVCVELFKKVNWILLQVETILDSVNNGIIVINNEGIVSLFNQAAEKMTRRTKSYALGRHLSEVIIPQGLLDVLKEGKGQSQHKLSITYTQGNRTYVTDRNPIYENGEQVGAVAVFQDISEIESVSAELSSVKQLKEKLELIIESVYDGIIITDPSGIILNANPAHERITGIPFARIQGEHMDKLVQKGIYSRSIVEAVMKEGKPVTMVEKDHYIVTGSPVRDHSGEIVSIVVNIRDLTELNDLREQLEKTQKLSRLYEDEISQLRSKLFNQEGLVFNSAKMRELLQVALRLALVDTTVLILGESGVGKEVIANTIHSNSKRKNGPFITVNCGAIPENLLESELFGYERGAFTGANREGKAGMFELANNGTLFLDEIGDLPLGFQVKLLRAIQEKEILRVGGNTPRPINVRILAATNRALEEMLKDGSFREDLYFRINVVPLRILPIRERREDIIPLIHAFKQKYENRYGFRKIIEPRVYNILLNYHWPGNVRELDNLIEMLMVTTPGEEITVNNLPDHLLGNTTNQQPEVYVKGTMPLKNAVMELERQLISNAIKEYGSANRAAGVLQVDQSTIARKISKLKLYGLNV